MKTIQKFRKATPCFVLIFFLLFSRMQCEKIDVPEIEKLPPVTQTGADTFGCLVNGKALTPRGYLFSGPVLVCNYQYVTDGYYFVLGCSDQKTFPNEIHTVRIWARKLALEEKEYILSEKGDLGNTYGTFEILSSPLENNFTTDQANQGKLIITRLDTEKQIISGTFWFDAINDKGEKVEVREGRFDMHYVK